MPPIIFIDETRSTVMRLTKGDMVRNKKIKLKVLPQVWHERPKTITAPLGSRDPRREQGHDHEEWDVPTRRSDCLTAEQLREYKLREWLEQNPGADERMAPEFEVADGMNCARPCPWVGCKHHLALVVNITRFSEQEVSSPFAGVVEDGDLSAMPQTCMLDVADEGEHTLEDVGVAMGISRQRVEAIEHVAQKRARAKRAAVDARAGWRVLLTRG